jgi:hypothetical protein
MKVEEFQLQPYLQAPAGTVVPHAFYQVYIGELKKLGGPLTTSF